MKKNRHYNVGFTIVEIFVTMTIISVLSALLLPVLGKAREKGREASCLSNLKQIGVVVELYTQDYNGLTPAIYDESDNVLAHVALNKYLRNANVFWCPSSGTNRKWDGLSAPIVTTGVSYGFNCFGTGSIGGAPNFSGFCSYKPTAGSRNIKEAKAPQQLLVASDTYYDLQYEYSVEYPSAGLPWGPGDIHRGGSNVLFADGHVMWHSLTYLRNTRPIWNYDNSNTDY